MAKKRFFWYNMRRTGSSVQNLKDDFRIRPRETATFRGCMFLSGRVMADKQKRKAAKKRYYEKYREILAAKNAEWRKKNRDHLVEYRKAYYLKNRERLLAQDKERYQKNRDAILLLRSIYYDEKKERFKHDAVAYAEWRRKKRDYQYKRNGRFGRRLLSMRIPDWATMGESVLDKSSPYIWNNRTANELKSARNFYIKQRSK